MLSAVIVTERSSVMRVTADAMVEVAVAAVTALVSLCGLGDLERLLDLPLEETLVDLDLLFSSAMLLLCVG